MKYFVQIDVGIEQGNHMERSGGPGPMMGRFIETFEPEALFMALDRRAMFMIADLDEIKMAQVMAVAAHMGGNYPTVVPVAAADAFGPLFAQAMPGAFAILDE